MSQNYQRIGSDNKKKKNSTRSFPFDIDVEEDEQNQLRRLGSIARTSNVVDSIFQRFKQQDDGKVEDDGTNHDPNQQEEDLEMIWKTSPMSAQKEGLLRDFSTPRVESDDEDDDDSTHAMDRYSTTAVISNKPGNSSSKNSSNAILSPTDSQKQQSDTKSCGKCVSSYYENYQRMRMESRQKRVQQAMELEDTPEGSVSYILGKIRLLLSSSWCDLTDFKGVFVVSLMTCGFIVVFYILEEKEYQSTTAVAATGIVMLIMRCLWWPIYWCCWGERALRVSFFSTPSLLTFHRPTVPLTLKKKIH